MGISVPWGGGINSHGFDYTYSTIISAKNLFSAWREFKRGKTTKRDVQEFEFNIEDNLFALREDLINKTYIHGDYQAFYVCDPKLRHIHKATVRDRVLHQAVFRILYKIFDKKFIYDSYSCRVGKGTHKGVKRLQIFIRKVTKNYRVNAYALKCDIRKFFENIDHNILRQILKRDIDDSNTLGLIDIILNSFSKGLPLGNVTSQLFANVYLNELDQFVKHEFKEKFYIRYCDDFLILNNSMENLRNFIPKIADFLRSKLGLELHPKKIFLRKVSQGVDFLGYVVIPHYVVLRIKTKRRIFRKFKRVMDGYNNGLISKEVVNCSYSSYRGIFLHASANKLRQKFERIRTI